MFTLTAIVTEYLAVKAMLQSSRRSKGNCTNEQKV